MASLFWHWNQYTLPGAAADIGDVKLAISGGLSTLGYTGVQNEVDAVHGFKGDYILSVLYLYIGGIDFWQVVACAGGSKAEADAAIDDVKKMINALTFV